MSSIQASNCTSAPLRFELNKCRGERHFQFRIPERPQRELERHIGGGAGAHGQRIRPIAKNVVASFFSSKRAHVYIYWLIAIEERDLNSGGLSAKVAKTHSQ